MSTTSEATPERFATLAARPADAPVVMVNLLKFSENGGLESYLRYGQEVAPHLERAGARILYEGTAPAILIGDGERPWWDVVIVSNTPRQQRSSTW